MGAKNGIVFKTAASLEETGRAQIVALDKTGTITQGTPRVTDIFPAQGVAEGELLNVAYALEQKSEHPLAKAINEYAAEKGIQAGAVLDFCALPGNGLTGRLEEDVVYGGSYSFIGTKADMSDAIKAKFERFAEEGKTPLFFSRGDTLLGMIAVADVIKPDSAQAIRELQNMGIRVIMLTGDNERTANAIGKQAGVDEVIAGVLPNGKESVIAKLKQEGKVIMVGDGINDSPALSEADVGVAISTGAAIAREIADITVSEDDLYAFVTLRELSEALMRRIRGNYRAIMSFNLALILLGVFGVLPPATGALLHNGSTVAIGLRSMTRLLEK